MQLVVDNMYKVCIISIKGEINPLVFGVRICITKK